MCRYPAGLGQPQLTSLLHPGSSHVGANVPMLLHTGHPVTVSVMSNGLGAVSSVSSSLITSQSSQRYLFIAYLSVVRQGRTPSLGTMGTGPMVLF